MGTGKMHDGKMHDGEVDIDADLVRRLLATQFPSLRDLPLHELRPAGTVNAMYRLGDDLCVRLPRVERWAGHLVKELEWLPRLAPHVPLAMPEPVATGEPGQGYPFPWAIYRWIEGETFARERVDDERQAATDLARFVTSIRRIDPTGAPRSGRLPLRDLDVMTRTAIGSLPGGLDIDAVSTAWERALDSPVWDGVPVWRHCDLLPSNLLVRDGRINAVIDFGGAGIGDPALDVVPAWSVFGGEGREAFRQWLDVDDGTWARARGFALHQALLIIPYYAETNPAFVTMATRTVQAVLDDLLADG